MSELPTEITTSKLWERLSRLSDFQAAVKGIRNTSEVVAAKIAEVLPEYTDHSVIHMDALWGVTQQVFTSEEMQSFSAGEAFILASSFYVHDIGMALAATPEGRAQLEQSSAYLSSYERAVHSKRFTTEEAKVLALKDAARETHAERAETFIDSPLPGLDRYLLESTELREQWGAHIGMVSASHHWSLQEVHRRLGNRGRVPDAVGGEVDLGLVACALRIIDYAHINAARASSLERILRSNVGTESLKHWKAQERITGPLREGDHLVFGSMRPIEDVDGWWTFYEMASGLDNEITSVKEYLSSRTVSAIRFSLEGVKGVKTPRSFATYVLTECFEPVDIRFRPNSMERLVELLGGKTLYGDDYFAPVRELLQNARDAITLQKAFAETNDIISESWEIRVTVETTAEGGALSFTDNGVGMSERVITDYLLGIASDYWHSPEFFSDYPEVSKAGFQPAGRFGIGFLSVFMVGGEVEVHTQKRGGKNLLLRLRGVGRRGALITQPTSLRSGTTVRVKVDRESLGNYSQLDKVIRAKAPMLDIPIRVNEHGSTTVIEPQWWQHCSQDELIEFISTQRQFSTKPSRGDESSNPADDYAPARYKLERVGGTWHGEQPEALTDHYRVLAEPSAGAIILCSRGFVVSVERWAGMSGLIEIGEVQLNAARSRTLQWNQKECLEDLAHKLRPKIKAALNNLANEQSIPSKYGFLVSVADIYGLSLLVETDLTWISVLMPPGRNDLISPKTLIDLCREKKEAVILYGKLGDPWNSINLARLCFPEISASALIVPVSANNQPSLRTRVISLRDEIKWGGLQSHFEREDQFSYLGIEKGYDGAMLLKATLKIVETAFDLPEQDLAKKNWARFEETVCLRFTPFQT